MKKQIQHQKLSLFLLVLIISISSINAQLDSIQLNEVEIRSIKKDSAKYYAYSISTENLENQYGRNLSSINESLNNFAGIFSLSGNNFAQDSRISSRGFGARGAFGIRGIKIFLDEIPLSTPDGQSQLDDINFNEIKKIVLIRGPVSGLYGNSSGGALLLSSASEKSQPSFRLAGSLGSFGSKILSMALNQSYKSCYFHTDYAHITQHGFRTWSNYKSHIFNANARILSKNNSLKFLFNYSFSPVANDPGALTAEEDQQHPEIARDKNILYAAGEKVNQARFGIVFSNFHLNEKRFNIKVYGSARNFEAKLPFKVNGGVELFRNIFGGNVDYFKTINFSKSNVFINLGLESEYQKDNRIQKDNNEGQLSDLIAFNQNEIFINHAWYGSMKYHFGRLNLHGSLRFDYNLSKVEDLYLINGDQSASLASTVFNPSLGLHLTLTKHIKSKFLYSQGFENPTLIELSNNPKFIGGFNQELKPMQSHNLEYSLEINNQTTFLNLSIFQIITKDEIVAFEIEGQSGRSFYKNFGKTKRNGVELEWNTKIKNWLILKASYTYSDFIYVENNNPGNKLPGIPVHQVSLETSITFLNRFIFQIDKKLVGKIALDDDNLFFTNSYIDLGLRCSFLFKIKHTNITSSLAFKNISSSRYYNNLRINANGERFYERAPGINLLAGIKIEI